MDFGTIAPKLLSLVSYIVLLLSSYYAVKNNKYAEFDVVVVVMSFIQMASVTLGFHDIAVSRNTPDSQPVPWLIGQITMVMNLFPMVFVKDWRIKTGYIVSLMTFQFSIVNEWDFALFYPNLALVGMYLLFILKSFKI